MKGKSVKNIITDLCSCLNWAKSKKLLRENPVNDADRSLIGSTKFTKPPLDIDAVGRAAQSIENVSDRAWFDVTRFTGMRKDEANRLQWSEINFDRGMIHIAGSKTEDSDEWLPLAPVRIRNTQAALRKTRFRHSLGICR